MVQIAQPFEKPRRGWVALNNCWELRDMDGPMSRKDVEELRRLLHNLGFLVEWTDDHRGLTLHWVTKDKHLLNLGQRSSFYRGETLRLSDNGTVEIVVARIDLPQRQF